MAAAVYPLHFRWIDEARGRLVQIEATKRGRNWYTTRRAIQADQESL